MSNVKVIEPEEMQSIQSLRDESTSMIYEFGQVELELMVARKRLEELENKRKTLENVYNDLSKKETELIQSLNEKYGAGTLDIEKGEFIPG